MFYLLWVLIYLVGLVRFLLFSFASSLLSCGCIEVSSFTNELLHLLILILSSRFSITFLSRESTISRIQTHTNFKRWANDATIAIREMNMVCCVCVWKYTRHWSTHTHTDTLTLEIRNANKRWKVKKKNLVTRNRHEYRIVRRLGAVHLSAIQQYMWCVRARALEWISHSFFVMCILLY